MIGQSIINVKSGGRTRLSSFSAGVLLIMVVLSVTGSKSFQWLHWLRS